jgi:putative transposase
MPRQARLDSPGLLQHVMVRGIARTDIFVDDEDRKRFVARLGRLLAETDTDCFAWALLPNHVHLLLRCNRSELSRLMRRLLTGHAVSFNRRHARVGHLFQNRYKSIVCEEEPYLLELIRYIHLNPLRAGLVQDLQELARYPWCGHGVLLGCGALARQATEEVLALFDRETKAARHSYLQFVADGIPLGSRPELVGGGLQPEHSLEVRLAEPGELDARVLGGSDFVAALREGGCLGREMAGAMELDVLRARIAVLYKMAPAEVGRRGRRNQHAEVRELFCFLAVRMLRYSGAQVGTALTMGVPSVSRAARRGEELMAARPELGCWWQQQIKQ